MVVGPQRGNFTALNGFCGVGLLYRVKDARHAGSSFGTKFGRRHHLAAKVSFSCDISIVLFFLCMSVHFGISHF